MSEGWGLLPPVLGLIFNFYMGGFASQTFNELIMTDTQMMIFELGSKGYTCAQILIIAALRAQGQENEELVRSMSALAQGIANTGKTCGALTGGLCLLSLYVGKGSDFEYAEPKEALMWEELIVWFEEEIGQGRGNDCDIILNIDDQNNQDLERINLDRRVCGEIVSKVWEKCLEILANHQIDPTSPKSVE